jgi:hypothetical protein
MPNDPGDFQDHSIIAPARPAPNMLPRLPPASPGPWPSTHQPPPVTPVTVPSPFEPSRRK